MPKSNKSTLGCVPSIPKRPHFYQQIYTGLQPYSPLLRQFYWNIYSIIFFILWTCKTQKIRKKFFNVFVQQLLNVSYTCWMICCNEDVLKICSNWDLIILTCPHFSVHYFCEFKASNGCVVFLELSRRQSGSNTTFHKFYGLSGPINKVLTPQCSSHLFISLAGIGVQIETYPPSCC